MEFFCRRLASLIYFLALSACTSVGEIKDFQSKLRSEKSDHSFYQTEEAVAREQSGNCRSVKFDEPFDVEISENDPIIRQLGSVELLANFQVRCLEADTFPEHLNIESLSYREAGGSFKAFFFIPRLVVFDENFQKIADKPNENAYHSRLLGPGRFWMKWDVQPKRAKKLFFIVEADNRFEGLPLSVNTNEPFSIYGYPTGRATFTIAGVQK